MVKSAKIRHNLPFLGLVVVVVVNDGDGDGGGGGGGVVIVFWDIFVQIKN